MKAGGLEVFIGRSPDALSLPERIRAAGKWIALELYTPQTLPFRIIEAIGDSPAECIRVLKDRGLDPRRFEFILLQRPL
jgi:hypothetical protein